MENKININIFIAIFLYGGLRLKLTELIFKHYVNIKIKFENKANFKFTIVGSEKELSKNLTLKYFNENEYFEFDQNKPEYGKYKIGYNNNFLKMLSDKINMGIKLASRDNDDIIFWAGSNDYISTDFFEQVIHYYNNSKKQIYGIDNYLNGNNINLYCKYDNETNNIDLKNDYFYWNGNHPRERKIYNYCGGIIGINKKLYNEYPQILDIWNYDEGFIEKYILDLQNIDKFNAKNIFWMNIKTNDNNEITTFLKLKNNYILNKSILNFDEFGDYSKNIINVELNNFYKLLSFV